MASGSDITVRRGRADMLFVSMPFAPLYSPSLGPSLLKPLLGAAGYRASVCYPGFDFAARIGDELYAYLADGSPAMHLLVGEWIFSHAVAPQSAADEARYL